MNREDKKNSKKKWTLLHELIESYRKIWEDPTCWPQIGI